MGRGKIKCQDVDWIHLAEDSDRWRDAVTTAMIPSVREQARKFLSNFATVSF
jgi:hypothetical protein